MGWLSKCPLRPLGLLELGHRARVQAEYETEQVAPDPSVASPFNLHFARWDRSHLHEFRLADGREIGFPDPDSPDTLDQERIAVASALGKGDEFEFVFDFGDHWAHQCRVEEVGIDAEDLYGETPSLPVPISGWGSIPDQYGRRTENDAGEDLEDP